MHTTAKQRESLNSKIQKSVQQIMTEYLNSLSRAQLRSGVDDLCFQFGIKIPKAIMKTTFNPKISDGEIPRLLSKLLMKKVIEYGIENEE